MDFPKIEHIALVGAKGQMGGLLRDRLTGAGIEVTSLDRPFPEEDLSALLAPVRMVLLAVPVSALDHVLNLVVPRISEEVIMADICSVKTVPLKKMQDIYPGPVLGTHPLFGPRPGADDDLKIALCPGRNLQEGDILAVRDLFGRAGMSTFLTTPAEHDQAMACIQSLNFVTTISYFASLPRDINLDMFSTPSFRRRARAAQKMLNEDAFLFSSLAEDNPYTGKMIRRFKSFLNLSAAGDFELLTDKALWWWRNFNEGQGGQ